MKKARSKRLINVGVDEFNKIVAAEIGSNIVRHSWDKRAPGESLTDTSFLTVDEMHVKFTTMYWEYPKPTTYICRLDGVVNTVIPGKEAFKEFQKAFKAPRLDHDQEFINYVGKDKKGRFNASASPLVGYNHVYDKRLDYVYVYDLNSAYAEQLCGMMPDTSVIHYNEDVKPGQVGFILYDRQGIDICEQPGICCDMVCDLMPSPWKEFAKTWYDRKKNPKSPEEKAKAKSILVSSVGYLQLVNPLLRAYIVGKCNHKIHDLIDENTIMWNTDAIYSLTPREDLVIGENIGEFKLEYQGMIEHIGNNYNKIDTGEISYRGMPKSWFKSGHRLLVDKLPTKEQSLYYFDEEKLQICKNSKRQTQD